VLARTEITITAINPLMASPGSRRTYLGKYGDQRVAIILPTTNPIAPSP